MTGGAEPQREEQLKRSLPSLIGGAFTGVVTFVLWLLLFGTADVAIIVLGVVIACAVAIWIRLADL
jgi:hypothetical protein